jgi:hypothetical protein
LGNNDKRMKSSCYVLHIYDLQRKQRLYSSRLKMIIRGKRKVGNVFPIFFTKYHLNKSLLGLKCGTHIRHIDEERAVCNEGRGGAGKNAHLKLILSILLCKICEFHKR